MKVECIKMIPAIGCAGIDLKGFYEGVVYEMNEKRGAFIITDPDTNQELGRTYKKKAFWKFFKEVSDNKLFVKERGCLLDKCYPKDCGCSLGEPDYKKCKNYIKSKSDIGRRFLISISEVLIKVECIETIPASGCDGIDLKGFYKGMVYEMNKKRDFFTLIDPDTKQELGITYKKKEFWKFFKEVEEKIAFICNRCGGKAKDYEPRYYKQVGSSWLEVPVDPPLCEKCEIEMEKEIKKYILRVKFEGIDSWNRVIFKQIDGEARFGTLEILLGRGDIDSGKHKKIKESDLVYFGNKFDCVPMGTDAGNIQIVWE